MTTENTSAVESGGAKLPHVSSQRPNETAHGYACRVAQTYAQMIPEQTVRAVNSHAALVEALEKVVDGWQTSHRTSANAGERAAIDALEALRKSTP